MRGITGPGGEIPIRALFQKRVSGDDALLRLARRRFERAGLAAEVYAGSADELAWVLGFAPPAARPPMVHLARTVDLFRPDHRQAIAQLARGFGSRVSGFVVHDRAGMAGRLDDVEAAAADLAPALEAAGVVLFVEYAAGLGVEEFGAVGERLARFEGLGLCIDTGHVGIRAARRDFARRRPDVPQDLIDLAADDPRLPDLVDDVQAAVACALPVVDALTRRLAAQGNPVHYHLHDGHPLIPGLADHRGFLTQLPIGFEHRGRRSLAPLYGPAGAAAIVAAALAAHADGGRVSFTLEIHDTAGRLPPTQDADLFRHWADQTNAERMNAWLEALAQNAQLIVDQTAGGAGVSARADPLRAGSGTTAPG